MVKRLQGAVVNDVYALGMPCHVNGNPRVGVVDQQEETVPLRHAHLYGKVLLLEEEEVLLPLPHGSHAVVVAVSRCRDHALVGEDAAAVREEAGLTDLIGVIDKDEVSRGNPFSPNDLGYLNLGSEGLINVGSLTGEPSRENDGCQPLDVLSRQGEKASGSSSE